MLYRAIVRSKLDYGFIVYCTESNTNLRQLDSIHNSVLRLALGAFCTSPLSSVYTEANEAPLEERRLKLSMHYYLKYRACIDNPEHALHEFDQITRDLYIHRQNGRRGMTRPLTPPVGLKVETAMTSAAINSELVCPLRTPSWWIQNEREGRGSSSCQSPFPEWWGNLYIVVYTDAMSCLQAIEGEDSEKPLICHILNLLWLLSDKGTHVRFCWIQSNCGIEGNKRVDQQAKEPLDHDIDPLTSVHYADLKPHVYSYIQQLVQVKWGVAVHGRDLYLLKPTLGSPKKWKHLTRVEEIVITQLRISNTKATKSHILSRGPPTACHHCGQTLTIDHMLLECAVLQESLGKYYTVDTLNTLFETIPESCMVEFLRELWFFYLIWTVRPSEEFSTKIIPERMPYSKLNQLLTWTI